MTLNELVKAAHENAKVKGFWDGENHNIGEKLALIHSEVSEALEDARKRPRDLNVWGDDYGKPLGFPTELIDVLIRTADLLGWLGIDAEEVLEAKLKYNSTRPRKHGKAF